MANKKWPVKPSLFKAGFPKQLPAESGTVAPTDKKTEKLRARSAKSAKRKQHKRQS